MTTSGPQVHQQQQSKPGAAGSGNRIATPAEQGARKPAPTGRKGRKRKHVGLAELMTSGPSTDCPVLPRDEDLALEKTSERVQRIYQEQIK